MKNNRYKNNINDFHSAIGGRPVPDLMKIISEGEPVTITLENNKDSGELCLVTKISRAEYAIVTPPLQILPANDPFMSNQGANFQKLIKTWADILKGNLEYWAECFGHGVTVYVDVPCLFKNYMWYTTDGGNVTTAHIHPYLSENYPSAFDEVQKELQDKGYIVKVQLFEEDV